MVYFQRWFTLNGGWVSTTGLRDDDRQNVSLRYGGLGDYNHGKRSTREDLFRILNECSDECDVGLRNTHLHSMIRGLRTTRLLFTTHATTAIYDAVYKQRFTTRTELRRFLETAIYNAVYATTVYDVVYKTTIYDATVTANSRRVTRLRFQWTPQRITQRRVTLRW